MKKTVTVLSLFLLIIMLTTFNPNNFNFGLHFFKIKQIEREIVSLGAKKIDYIENYDIKNFKKLKKPKKNFNLFIAYYIENTRLIDNI